MIDGGRLVVEFRFHFLVSEVFLNFSTKGF